MIVCASAVWVRQLGRGLNCDGILLQRMPLLHAVAVPPPLPLFPRSAGTMATRTRVTVAGAVIAAVADMLLILLVGWHSDDGTSGRTVHEEGTGGQGLGGW